MDDQTVVVSFQTEVIVTTAREVLVEDAETAIIFLLKVDVETVALQIIILAPTASNLNPPVPAAGASVPETVAPMDWIVFKSKLFVAGPVLFGCSMLREDAAAGVYLPAISIS